MPILPIMFLTLATSLDRWDLHDTQDDLSWLEVVEGGVFGFEVVAVGFFAERLAGDFFAKLIEVVGFAILMDVGSEPFADEGEIALFNLFFPMGVFFGKGGEELGGEDIAEGVSGEVAEGSDGPVNILEAAFSIIWGSFSEEFFEFGIPGIGKVSWRKSAGNELFFEFKAEDDVKAIGNLVCLDSDEGRGNGVNSPIKSLEGDFF